MAAPVWKFVLTNLSGTQLGEITQAGERSVVRSLGGVSSASAKMLVSDPIFQYTLNTDMLMKVYRNSVLIFHGLVISAELAVEDATATPAVALNAVDPSWRLTKRLAGKSTTGTIFASTDVLSIAESLITTANGETNGETGISVLGQTSGSSRPYIAGPYRNLMEVITELAQSIAGFDWRIDPKEYASGKIGSFKAGATLGSTRTGTVFEYQGRANTKVPNYQRTWNDIANKVYSIPDGGPADAAGVRSKNSTVSMAARGVFEDAVDTSNITNSTLRDDVLDSHILYRKNPRQILTFSPDMSDYTGRVPEYGVDYEIADYVRARVLYNNVALVDGYVRLYKMQFDIDGNDTESLTPTLVQET